MLEDLCYAISKLLTMNTTNVTSKPTSIPSSLCQMALFLFALSDGDSGDELVLLHNEGERDRDFLLLIAACTILALRLMSMSWLSGLFFIPLSKKTKNDNRVVGLARQLSW